MNLVPNAELFFLDKKKLVKKSTHELFAKARTYLLLALMGLLCQQMRQMVKDFEKNISKV